MVQIVWKGICQYLSYTCTYALIQNSTSIVTCNIQYAKKKKNYSIIYNYRYKKHSKCPTMRNYWIK